MIHKVYREEYEGLTTGLELPVRGDMNNGHRHHLGAIEDRFLAIEEQFVALSALVEKMAEKEIEEKRKD
uniref:Uncharacterized protein n=1 Tax=viral metagenome TaxID=1070528 RepID=A0A6H1ZI97_9ZZZZ